MHPRPAYPSVLRHRSWPKVIINATLISLLVALTYFWLTQESPPPGYIPDKTYKLTIVNTSELPRDGKTANNNEQLRQRQALIDKIRSDVETAGGKLLLLSGGELSSDDDILNLKQLNQLGYHAMAVSPLLFDEPLINIRTQEASADFPFLSANLYESETGRPLFDAYALFDFDGLRIAVMGLTSPGASPAGIPENRRGIEFIDPELAALELVPYLREQADIVIVATHARHYPALTGSSGNTPADPADKLEGIDLMVGNRVSLPDEARRITEISAPFNASPCCSAIRRVDLEFRNGEIKKQILYK